MRLRNTKCVAIWYIWLACMCVGAEGNIAQALQLSAEQLKIAQQLPASEKMRLAKQMGVPTPSGTSSNKSISAPKPIKARILGNGPLENQVKQGTVDEAQRKKDIQTSSRVKVPVAKVASQVGADKLELRKSFADFVAESKPLTVDTSQLKQFGYALFAGSPTTFAPATDVPVPAEYVLGPGDELQVQLFGAKSNILTLVIDREGAVAFPGLGPIVLVGMSFSEAQALLVQRVNQNMVGVTLNVNMGKLRSIRIFALGEVAQPGSYVVSGLATLSQALMVSGGVKKTGSLRTVQLKRQGKLVATIDLYDFLLKGDTSKDVRLLPGDVVFVQPIGMTASIAGAVLRPAIYELKSSATVGSLVELAGGLLSKAFIEKAIVEGLASNQKKYVKSFKLKGEGLKTRLHDGDLIKVFSALDFEENPVLLIGNVKRPGKYAWNKGMHLSNLISSADALLPETYMDYGIIEREAKGSREPEIMRFRLKDLFLHGKKRINIVLKPRDKVYVFNRYHFRIAPKASVAGSVKSPGQYELKKNMRLLDLIMASGGLTRDSLMDMAELYRTDPMSKDVEVLHFNVARVMKANKKDNLLLQDLDRIVIHSLWENQYKEVVTIQGQVKKPGKYQRAKNMRVSDLIFAASGKTRNTLMGEAQIYRTNDKTKKVNLLTFDVGKALHGDMANNPLLQDLDRVVIHSVWEDRYKEVVSIQGEVKKAGEYPRAQNMHVSDLIFAASGPTRNTLIGEAQIYRTDDKTKKVNLLTFDVGKALHGDMANNPLLQDLDRVVIHSVWEDRYKEVVSIQGEVKKAGEYPRAQNMHVSDLIFAASGPTRDTLIGEAQIYRTDDKTKEISLLTFDVGKALQGDMENNPILHDLDRVIIHSIWEVKKRSKVRVLGEVKKPGEYLLADGLHISDLIFAAGNVSEKAYMKKVELTRYKVVNGDKRLSRHLNIDLQAALNGDEKANLELQPYDTLYVRTVTNWRAAEHVAIRGEVLFPGGYPVEEGERLSSLIERAGGITEKAYLKAAIFTRVSILKEEQNKLDKLARQAREEIARMEIQLGSITDAKLLAERQASIASAQAVVNSMKEVKATGRLVIELKNIKRLKGSDFDIALHDGDSLYIPKRPDQVLVLGQVYNNTALLYQKKFSLDDYINRSGGMTRHADEGNIYVVHASGMVEPAGGWYSVKIGPGDAIVVPEDVERFNWLGTLVDWSKVFYQFGTSLASMRVVGLI